MQTTVKRVNVGRNIDQTAWKWMRYSGILLIPLAWVHVAIQDVLVGVHRIDLDYVALRWASLGWRTFDFLLLAFALAHGVNGLRQVLQDFIKTDRTMRIVTWGLLVLWLVVALIGAIALIGGVRQ